MKNTNTIDRNAFLKRCGAVCVGTSALSTLLTSCLSVYYAQAPRLKGWPFRSVKKSFSLATSLTSIARLWWLR
ncbi:hypothetical protein A6C57_28215 (plasmid) [Fibrella sp. ES10-3-2-2]